MENKILKFRKSVLVLKISNACKFFRKVHLQEHFADHSYYFHMMRVVSYQPFNCISLSFLTMEGRDPILSYLYLKDNASNTESLMFVFKCFIIFFIKLGNYNSNSSLLRVYQDWMLDFIMSFLKLLE